MGIESEKGQRVQEILAEITNYESSLNNMDSFRLTMLGVTLINYTAELVRTYGAQSKECVQYLPRIKSLSERALQRAHQLSNQR